MPKKTAAAASPAPSPLFPLSKLRRLSELEPVEYNPRQISEAKAASLGAGIQEFGLVQPLVVNVHPGREGRIIGGTQRYFRLLAMKAEEAPCVEVNLNLADERRLNLALNKVQGEWDDELLREHFTVEELLDGGWERWEFRDLPKEELNLEGGGGPTGAAGPKGASSAPPPSPVRMVQLFFNQADFERWEKALAAAGEKLGTETTTDTALAAVLAAAE